MPISFHQRADEEVNMGTLMWNSSAQNDENAKKKKMQKTKNCDEMLEWWIKGLVVQILALGRHYLLRTRGDSRPPAARLNDSWQYFSLERFLAHFLCSAINRFPKGFASHSLPSSSVVHAKKLKVFIVPCHLPLIIHGFHHFLLYSYYHLVLQGQCCIFLSNL